MTVSFLLNGESVNLDVIPNKRLVDILRENFHLKASRPGCYAGVCGACAVFLNGELTYSCLVPIFAVQDSEVVTYEGFEGTEELEEILAGFEAAGYHPCANCRESRALITLALLASTSLPQREDIDAFFGGVQCRCTSMSELYRVIENLVRLRRIGRHGRS